MEEKIAGKITHYFSKIGVAVIEITDCAISVGDMVKFKGAHTDFDQKISSMQIDHQEVAVANEGESVGLKTDAPVHENDLVYIIR